MTEQSYYPEPSNLQSIAQTVITMSWWRGIASLTVYLGPFRQYPLPTWHTLHLDPTCTYIEYTHDIVHVILIQNCSTLHVKIWNISAKWPDCTSAQACTTAVDSSLVWGSLRLATNVFYALLQRCREYQTTSLWLAMRTYAPSWTLAEVIYRSQTYSKYVSSLHCSHC